MKLVIAALAVGCAVVGVLWGLRWLFEGRVIAGSLSPDDAMLALNRWTVILRALVAIVAAALAGLLLHLAAATRKRRQWPPSGRWPAPRAVSEAEAGTIARRLLWAAAAVGLLGIGALATAVA